MAKLYFRYGAMNSGKSTALMQVAHNYEERGMKVRVIKPSIDTKGADMLVSRLGVKRLVDKLVSRTDNIFELYEDICKGEKISCFLVDEAQFLTEAQVDQLMEIASKHNVPVICYGLRTDFLTNGFPGSKRLLLIAHSLEELKTICRCGKKAVLNGRKINGVFVFEGDQVAIDDEDEIDYEALCVDCYYKNKKEVAEKK